MGSRAEPAECRAEPTENNAEPESDRRKRTEGADAGPAFAEPEQAFAADLFATTVHLLDDCEFDETVLAAR